MSDAGGFLHVPLKAKRNDHADFTHGSEDAEQPLFLLREAERNDADGHNRSYDLSAGRTLVRRLFM